MKVSPTPGRSAPRASEMFFGELQPAGIVINHSQFTVDEMAVGLQFQAVARNLFGDD